MSRMTIIVTASPKILEIFDISFIDVNLKIFQEKTRNVVGVC